MKTDVYTIDNLCCATEEQLIRNRLSRIDGISGLDFNLLERQLTVRHELDGDSSIRTALDALGLPARTAATPEGPRPNYLPLVLSGLCAGSAEGVAWATGHEEGWPVLALALASMALGGRETLFRGWVALVNRTLNINFLMTVAVIGAACLGQWPEAAMVTFLFGLAERIEESSLNRARNSIRALMELSPDQALVKGSCCSDWHEVPAEQVQVGQIVRVRPGARVPLDGKVVSGNSAVNQAPITGESMPVEKGPGDPVYAGTVNETGTFEFEVTANRGNTTLDRIVQSVQQAQGARAPTQRFVDRFAAVYTPLVCLAALLVAVLPPLVWGQPWLAWIYRALVMLVIACPCALVLSTPVTVVSGLAAAARRGILVKGGVFLEQGCRLRALALDKTGTLTVGRPGLTEVIVRQAGLTRERALEIAAAVDLHSEHPTATAIVRAHPGQPPEVTAFQALPGRGARAELEGTLYWVGNHRLVHDSGICTPELEEVLNGIETSGRTAICLFTRDEVLAVMALEDTLRDNARDAVQDLQKLGVHTVILTGDNPLTAAQVAARVGVQDARGNLLPEEKLQALEQLIKVYQHVGMVGDGVNDAPALARSSIGFALGAAGTATALETADVALMQDDLSRLAEFIRLSRQTVRILQQNIAFAIGLKAVFFALALYGSATLWMAVFADMGGSLIVVLNGLRLARVKAPPARACHGECCHH